MRVVPIACLSDNYAYLLSAGDEGARSSTSEPDPVLRALSESGGRNGDVKVVAILDTHHHHDHVAATSRWRRASASRACTVTRATGPHPEPVRVLEEGSSFTIGSLLVRVLHIPGTRPGPWPTS